MEESGEQPEPILAADGSLHVLFSDDDKEIFVFVLVLVFAFILAADGSLLEE